MKTPRTLSQSIIVFSTLVESLFFGVMDRKKKKKEKKKEKKKNISNGHNFVWTFGCSEELRFCQVIFVRQSILARSMTAADTGR